MEENDNWQRPFPVRYEGEEGSRLPVEVEGELCRLLFRRGWDGEKGDANEQGSAKEVFQGRLHWPIKETLYSWDGRRRRLPEFPYRSGGSVTWEGVEKCAGTSKCSSISIRL